MRISDFQRNKEGDRLDRVVSSVHIIPYDQDVLATGIWQLCWGSLTHKEVVRVRIRAANFEEFHQIVKLTMDIAAYCDGAFLLEHVNSAP